MYKGKSNIVGVTTCTALKALYHDDPVGLIHSRRVVMMHEWVNAVLASRLARAAFMHHDDQWHDALKHYATLKGLTTRIAVVTH